jgi:LytR cell envelope-related transcriptional attenuator
VAVALAVAPRRERVSGHAYPIPSSAPGGVQVEVLNGTRRAGYARSATRLLRRHGLDVVYLGNADSLSHSTRVLVRRGDAARGHRVAEVLGVAQVLIATDTLRRVDVSVILGEDFRPAGELHP